MSMTNTVDHWATQFAACHAQHAPFPSLAEAESDATLDDAYAVQGAFLAALDGAETIAGYKAALTAPQAQQAMGIDQPILGALFASGDFPSDAPVQLARQCILETEIGLRVATPVSSPISAGDVADIVDACMPMIELASPNMAGRPSGIDLVATNSASYGFIAGAAITPDWGNIDALDVSLADESATLHAGSSGDVLGGQREALAWLINGALRQGYVIEAGQLFMTGSIGGMQPAKPGAYRASFGALGEIEFSIA